MTLVTVGTVSFDSLVIEVDRLAAAGIFTDEVFAQIGLSRYTPQHVHFARYCRNLAERMREASLIVTHAGTGCVSECIASGRPFIAVVDSAKAGNHQLEFAQGLAERFDYCWIRDPAELAAALPHARPATRLDAVGVADLAADIRRTFLT